jgi:hypothetical protein
LFGSPVQVPEWARAGPGWSLVDRRLQLARYLVAQGLRGPVAEALERAEQIVPLLEVPDPVICHGDFHPRNLLLDAGTVWVIDWTDGGIGDRHGDIAKTEWLFRFATVALNGEAGRAVSQALPAMSRCYLTSYRRELPVDAARLRLWMPLHHLSAWAAAVAARQGFFGPLIRETTPVLSAGQRSSSGCPSKGYLEWRQRFPVGHTVPCQCERGGRVGRTPDSAAAFHEVLRLKSDELLSSTPNPPAGMGDSSW